MGGTLLTLRFDLDDPAPLLALLRTAATMPRICGAHLCTADTEASGVRTAESRDRTDILQPPSWFLLVEATDPGALEPLLPEADLAAAGLRHIESGCYRLEHVRGRTGWT